MFAIITYKYVGGGSSGEPVLKVRFSDTVVFDIEHKYSLAPMTPHITAAIKKSLVRSEKHISESRRTTLQL